MQTEGSGETICISLVLLSCTSRLFNCSVYSFTEMRKWKVGNEEMNKLIIIVVWSLNVDRSDLEIEAFITEMTRTK